MPGFSRRLRIFSVVLATGVLFAAILWQISQPTLLGDTRTTSAFGGVTELKVAGDSASFFIATNRSARYWVKTSDAGALEALNKSSESGNSVTLRVHFEGAWFDKSTDRPQYWVESIGYLGKDYHGFPARPGRPWRPLSPAAASLLRGYAFSQAHRYPDTIRELDASLSAGSLSSRRQALAYYTRGSAREDLAYPPGSVLNDRDDKLLLDAEADYRRAAELDRDDERAVFGRGGTLSALGAYTQALVLYDEVERRWPQQYFRVAIRKGVTFRMLGDYRAALRALDDMAEVHGPQSGMMYHYHRAWTLYEMRRYADAVSDLSKGIETQPDFLWAFVRRSCAYAQLGELELARADQQRALELWNRSNPDAMAASGGDRAYAELRAALRGLEAAQQSRASMPADMACPGMHDSPQTQPRKRSRLLPADTRQVSG